MELCNMYRVIQVLLYSEMTICMWVCTCNKHSISCVLAFLVRASVCKQALRKPPNKNDLRHNI